MILTDKQLEGLETAVARYKEGKKYSVIAGYAGTGKSTLVKHIIAALGVPERDVVYCAYTGKATLVLASKGCKNTSTLHKLLYTAQLNRHTGKFSFFPRTTLARPYKIVVVDEVSMLPMEMWKLLVKHNTYVLALGDPGQLGPIKADKDSGLLQSPNIFLTEIMRQAEGNEIIKLSMDIRQGKPLQPFKGEHVQIIGSDELNTGMLEWADVVLCAKNDTRHHLNAQLREIKGMGVDPEIGDKVICLKNYWDTVSWRDNIEDAIPLVNGALGTITDVSVFHHRVFNKDMLRLSFITELGEEYNDLTVDYQLMMTGKPSMTYPEFINISRSSPGGKIGMPMEFAFGYAITTWKAQGSEWDNVLLFEEAFPFVAKEKKRYLYTGVTRASEKIVVVRR